MTPDETLRDIERMKRRIEESRFERQKRHAHSATGMIQKDIAGLHWFILQVIAGFWWISSTIIRPTGRFLARPIKALWRAYRRLWDRSVHYVDAYGMRRFSKVRAGLFIIATGAGIYIFPTVALFCLDIALYLTTSRRDELVYMTKPEEVLPLENIHSARGCRALPCAAHNSIYFRVRPLAFNHLWSLLNGHGFFFPDYVAAAVPSQVSLCAITSYGIRVNFFMRWTEVYPDLLDAECMPLMQEESENGSPGAL